MAQAVMVDTLVSTTTYRDVMIEVWYCKGSEQPYVKRGWYAIAVTPDGTVLGPTKTLQAHGYAEMQARWIVDQYLSR